VNLSAIQATIRRRLQEAIIHPFVSAIFPVLSLYVYNMGKGHFREAIAIAIGVSAFAALLWLFVGLFVKDRRKAAVIVSSFFILSFSYGHAISAAATLLEHVHLREKVESLVAGESALQLGLVLGSILFTFVCYFTVRSKSDLRLATRILNTFALALMVVVAVNFVAGGVQIYLPSSVRARIHSIAVRVRSGPARQTRTDTYKHRVHLPLAARDYRDTRADERDQTNAAEFMESWQEQEQVGAFAESAVSDSSPDIYYIILDMYARADFLEKKYHYDNSDFLSFLTDRGFYVADQSRTNYAHTPHSLASTLNLMYLDDIAEQMGDASTNYEPLFAMLKHNRLFQFLRHHGYTIVAFSTGHEFTEIRDADVYMSPAGWQPTDFQNALLSTTPLAVFRKTQDDIHRGRILYTFDHLADAAQIEAPTFAFAHISSPHPPYVFGANGEPVHYKPHVELEYDEFVEAYVNQLAYISKRTQATIDEILAQSPEPPIIIVQSDHGPVYLHHDIPDRMSILNAYYFPDQNYDALYEGITPVNTFRIVLNGYFGTDYEILEDKSYFSEYRHKIYSYTDVTGQVLAGG
jgi:hypothetical protein